MDRRRQIPDGVQDTYVTECYNKRLIESLMRDEFISSGYDEIETPGFEYYDVFSSGIGSVKQESLIKFFDEKGRILAMRPEFTIPIARMAAGGNICFPARYCYVGNAYGNDGTYYGSQKEFTQAGIELLGESEPEADAEVLTVALSALQKAGLKNVQIDIGQVEFFKGLMEEAGLTKPESEYLRVFVDKKDDLAVELFLKEMSDNGRPVASAVADTIRQLPMLYGGSDVFDKAERMSSSERCRSAVQNLRKIYDILCDFGLSENISIDFGMLQSIDYYSGLIFKGYADAIGFPILSGGRYDDLLSEFGLAQPATGCAIGIKRILIAMERENQLQSPRKTDFVVSSDPAKREECYRKILSLKSQGKRVISALQYDQYELLKYAESIGAAAIYVD